MSFCTGFRAPGLQASTRDTYQLGVSLGFCSMACELFLRVLPGFSGLRAFPGGS